MIGNSLKTTTKTDKRAIPQHTQLSPALFVECVSRLTDLRMFSLRIRRTWTSFVCLSLPYLPPLFLAPEWGRAFQTALTLPVFTVLPFSSIFEFGKPKTNKNTAFIHTSCLLPVSFSKLVKFFDITTLTINQDFQI